MSDDISLDAYRSVVGDGKETWKVRMRTECGEKVIAVRARNGDHAIEQAYNICEEGYGYKRASLIEADATMDQEIDQRLDQQAREYMEKPRTHDPLFTYEMDEPRFSNKPEKQAEVHIEREMEME